MELKTYWDVVWRRLWVVVGTFALALAASLAGLTMVPQAISYQAAVSLAIRPAAEPETTAFYTYGEYYPYLASEFLNDDVIDLAQSARFMQDLQARLKDRFASPPSGSIVGKKGHRVLTLTVTSRTPEGALALAQAAYEALAEQRYFAQLSEKQQTVTVVDPPAIVAGPGTRSQLDLALRGLVGLLAGLALAFLLDYLDDTVRGPAEVEQRLGLPVLGEIPPERGGRAAAGVRGAARVGAAGGGR